MRGQLWLLGVVAVSLAMAAGCARAPAPSPHAQPDAAAALARANELSSRHHVAEALASIESYRAQSSSSPMDEPEVALRKRQAELLVNLSRPREALILLDELAPRLRGSWSFLQIHAQACLDSGEPARALAEIGLAPGIGQEPILVEQGTALAAVGRVAEGVGCLAAALILDPWRDLGYLELGRALARAGKPTQAALFLERYRDGEAYRRADQEAVGLEFEGNESRALHRRALAEAERGRIFETLKLENRALQLKPGQGESYVELGRLSILLARPHDAIETLQRLPQNAQVKETLDLALAASRDPREAPPGSLEALRLELALQQAKKPLSSCVPELLELASAASQAGQARDARKLSLLAVQLAPAKLEPRLAAARFHAAPGEVFIRLWALQPIKEPAVQSQFDAELTAAGIGPPETRDFLAKK